LILATLIQSGMVLGPGAAGGGAEDGGIERREGGVTGFAGAGGPAVWVEWGGGLDPRHVVKALAAGVLRFQQFLGGEGRKLETARAFGRREVKLSRVDLRDGETREEVEFWLSLTGDAGGFEPGERESIEVPFRFFVQDEDGLVRMLPAVVSRIDWGGVTRVPGDASGMATLRAVVKLGEEDGERLRAGFWGYAIWVVRDGVVEDRRATPERLADQLWRWEGS
jgi:hypothetical protein